MANFTIIRNGLNTEIVGDPHIGQSSEDVTVAVKDDGTYSGYAKRLYYSYCYHNELHRALSAVNSNNEFIIPVQAFFEPGMVKLSVELSNGTNCPACNACFLIVTDGAKDVDTSVLPSEKTWQSYIQSYIKSDVDALGKRIDNLILSSGTESSAEVIDARTGYDGTSYDTLGTAIRTQASELKSDLVDLRSERTEQLFDYKSSNPIKYYIDTAKKKLMPHSSTLSVVIPISVDKKTRLFINKNISSKFLIASFTSENPIDVVYTNYLEFGNDSGVEFVVDETIKSIVIWYHYNTEENVDEILKSISVSTKYLQFYTPYKAPIGYSEHKDCLSTTDEIDGVLPFDKYNSINKSNDSIYVNDYIYKKGFVKNIKVKVNDTTNSNIEVYIIKAFDNVVLRNYSVTGVGELLVNVREYIGQDFYVAVGGVNASFNSFKYGKTNVNFTSFGRSNYKEGDIVPITFPPRTSGDTIYSIAHQVIYSSLQDTVYEERKIVTHNNMFAVGDSITAGHNSYREGEHWWECVAREYNYKVTPGGRSGSGMVYNNGTCGVLQARNTDFKKYNVAVFAFGTNDYGNNYNLGSFTDSYVDDNNTSSFYAGVKEIIRLVKTSNPACTLVFSLPINRIAGSIESKWAYGTPNTAGHTLNDYCEAIVTCCNYYGIPYIDHRNGAFDSYSLSTLLYDGLHPSVDGYKILGQEMSAKLGSIIRPYVEYNGIGGIGKW